MSTGGLDEATFRRAVMTLSETDPLLGAVVDHHGPPEFWTRKPGLETLLLLILEQQVLLASAKAAYDRLELRVGTITPAAVLGVTDEALRADGFSRQKARYARALAAAVHDGSLDLGRLGHLPEQEAHSALLALPGIGPWTADVYLLASLRRPDVWPAGDLALQEAARTLLGLPTRPGADALTAIGERWRPHRATAARILWHLYLGTRSRTNRHSVPSSFSERRPAPR